MQHPPFPAEPARPAQPSPVLAGFAALAERLRPALWRYARVLGADAASADDLVQEAFAVALQRAGFDASAPGAVFTFLRTTCRNLWLRSRRRTNSERDVAEADAVWAQNCGDGAGDDYVDALRACLDRLPARSQALLAATYGDGHGRQASGAAFGLSRDGVKSALRRLRTFLHDCIRSRLETTR
ncbi:MAG: sigma-70 family RNA polymerase sigma factor [Planctomycetes bacterium]|nr:sigma-70 family RNA polymerase sigma factor [Planctomycetota bacterium]